MATMWVHYVNGLKVKVTGVASGSVWVVISVCLLATHKDATTVLKLGGPRRRRR